MKKVNENSVAKVVQIEDSDSLQFDADDVSLLFLIFSLLLNFVP